MSKIKIKIYENDMKTVEKESVAETVAIPFGIIRKLMKLFNVENMENTNDILKIVANSFDEVVKLLERIFPDVTEDEWDYVDIKELVKAIYNLIKKALKDIASVPVNEKNE